MFRRQFKTKISYEDRKCQMKKETQILDILFPVPFAEESPYVQRKIKVIFVYKLNLFVEKLKKM